MPFTKLHESAGEHRGVEYQFTIMEHDGTAFSEVSYTLPHGPAVDVVDSVPYPTIEHAIEAVKKRAAAAIDLWLDKQSK